MSVEGFGDIFRPKVSDGAELMLKARQLILEVCDEVAAELKVQLDQAGGNKLPPEAQEYMEAGARAAVGLTFARWESIAQRVREIG